MARFGSLGARQFLALVHKNLILQVRSRKTFLGIGGWGALFLQVRRGEAKTITMRSALSESSSCA